MGYTHYWKNTDAPTPEFIAAVRKVIAASPVKLANLMGTEGTQPEVTADRVAFNGCGDDAYESFVFEGGKEFEFCKTARRSYDVVVTAVLALVAHFGLAEVSSDGGAEEWTPGIDLARRKTGLNLQIEIDVEGEVHSHAPTPPDPLEAVLAAHQEKRDAERTAAEARQSEIKAAVLGLWPDLHGEQMGYFVLSQDDVGRIRQENNVTRPSTYGATINHLTTTIAALIQENRRLRASAANRDLLLAVAMLGINEGHRDARNEGSPRTADQVVDMALDAVDAKLREPGLVSVVTIDTGKVDRS